MNASLSAEASDLLAQAVDWRLLSLLFSRPSQEVRAEAECLAREVRDPVLRRCATLFQGAEEGPYHALLGHGGAASAREAAYLGFGDPGRTLAEIRAHHEAFGFAARSEEPVDHLAQEADFVAYLAVKEVHALARGEREPAEVTREARERFLAEHVTALGRGLAAKLTAGPEYLREAAAALLARLAHLPERPMPVLPCSDPLEAGCAMSGGCAPEP